jgi:hypothetical protein
MKKKQWPAGEPNAEALPTTWPRRASQRRSREEVALRNTGQ